MRFYSQNTTQACHVPRIMTYDDNYIKDNIRLRL